MRPHLIINMQPQPFTSTKPSPSPAPITSYPPGLSQQHDFNDFHIRERLIELYKQGVRMFPFQISDDTPIHHRIAQ